MIDSQGRLFGKVNVIDAVVVGAIVLAIFAFVLSRGNGQAQVAGETRPVEIDMMVRSLSIGDPTIFKIGEKTAVVIRNQPAGELTIKRVQVFRHQVPVVIGNQVQNVPQPGDPYGNRDYLVTLGGDGSITPDGVVISRVKAKIGTPIEIEGFKYTVRGGIIDVRVEATS